MDWKKTLATVAPAVATALGGPLAGVAAHVAVKALGGEDKGEQGNIDAIQAAVLSGQPNVLVALKEAENNLKIELKRLNIDLDRIHASDRNSARDLAKAVGIEPQVILSVVYTGGYFWLAYLLFTGQVNIPEAQSALGDGVIAIMTAAQLQIMNFWFGSSRGSRDKDRVIANSRSI